MIKPIKQKFNYWGLFRLSAVGWLRKLHQRYALLSGAGQENCLKYLAAIEHFSNFNSMID
jgi:hypothetical protein